MEKKFRVNRLDISSTTGVVVEWEWHGVASAECPPHVSIASTGGARSAVLETRQEGDGMYRSSSGGGHCMRDAILFGGRLVDIIVQQVCGEGMGCAKKVHEGTNQKGAWIPMTWG